MDGGFSVFGDCGGEDPPPRSRFKTSWNGRAFWKRTCGNTGDRLGGCEDRDCVCLYDASEPRRSRFGVIVIPVVELFREYGAGELKPRDRVGDTLGIS